VPECLTHYSPAGNGDMPDIWVYKNARFSNIIASDILDSDHLPITFYILDHLRITKLLKPLVKFTDWDWSQSLAANLIL
jgi:hypothetical protein